MRPSLKPKYECEASLPVTISMRDLSELVQICHWISPELKIFRQMAQQIWQTICHEQSNSFMKTPTEYNIQLMSNTEKRLYNKYFTDVAEKLPNANITIAICL